MPSDPLILRPNPNCKCCDGRGHYYERHDDYPPERRRCSCVIHNAPKDAESQARIFAKDFVVITPDEPDEDEQDFHADDLVDPDAGYDPQERMQWDGRDEP